MQHGTDGFLVTAHHGVHILCTARPALYLEHTHTGMHHAVNEAYGLEVLRRHDVFVVYEQFVACLNILHAVFAAAYLHTLTAVGRAPYIMQREVALA